MQKFFLACLTAITLWGCGGGGGGSTSAPPVAVDPPVVVTPPVVTPPVTPPDPVTPPPVATPPQNLPLASTLAGVCTPEGEKSWIRSHLNEVYLWYKEIVDVPPASYATPADYFSALLVKAKDRFSFTQAQSTSDSYFEAGTEAGYGMNLVNIGGRLYVSIPDAGSPADRAGIRRGAQITALNGTPIGQVSREMQLAGLYPSTAGQRNTFGVLDNGAAEPRTVELVSEIITIDSVPVTRVVTTEDKHKIGYLAFTDHIATAEEPLIAAIRTFKDANVEDVVLDLRYNGGGYIYIADILASMLGGSKVKDKVFESLVYNDKQTSKNSNFDFYTFGTRGFTILPTMNLPRVFVLTTSRTCSASEGIINALKPFMEVITIGATTCGKPYGMVQTNNCGTSYFAIQFVGVNHNGEGNYQNGFAPACALADDVAHDLGDPAERLFAGALTYARTGACPAAKVSQASARPITSDEIGIQPVRNPLRDNMLVK
jgi:carboxyl-terminal processing protease